MTDHGWLNPTVGDPSAWREVCADMRRGQLDGRWLTDTITADDWPGDPKVWRKLVGVEQTMRRLAKQPSAEPPRPEQPQTRIPARYRDPDTAPAWLEQSDAWAAAMQWVAEHMGPTPPDRGLLLLGGTGTGKTGIATAVAVIAGEPHRCGYWPVRDLLTAAKEDMADGGRTLHLARQKPLLVLDDLGVERRTPYNADLVGGLIEHRHAQGLPLIVTSNLTHDGLRAHLGEAGHDRAYSRLIEVTDDLPVVGADRRWGDA